MRGHCKRGLNVFRHAVAFAFAFVGAAIPLATSSRAQTPPLEITTGLQGKCNGKIVERPFSIQFQVDDKNYEKQIEGVWTTTNTGDCRLTPDAKAHLTKAIDISRKALNGDFYVAVKMMMYGAQEPWADVHFGDECLRMKGGDTYAYRKNYLQAVTDINEYSAKLRKLPLSNLERISIIGRMDVINGRLGYCAAAGGDDITQALIDDSEFMVRQAKSIIERELAGRRAESDHVIVSSQKGGGSSPPFFPKGFFKR